MVNEQDGEPAMGASVGGWNTQARANVEMSLVLPFAAPAAGALVATGTAVTVPAVTAWGADAFAAYRAAKASYSLGAAAASGAFGSGLMYTAGTGIGAASDAYNNNESFGAVFDQRFSYWGLGGATAVGAVGGMYQTQMLQWANIENKLIPSLQTWGGWVIRGNKAVAGGLAGKATQAVVQESEQQKKPPESN